MKQIIIKVPDHKYDFFMELMNNLGFNSTEKDEFVLSSAHKKILDERLKNMAEEPEAESDWNTVKKNLGNKPRKTK